MIIHIENSDCNIWNKDFVVSELTKQMVNKEDSICITTNNEGPCAESLGLYNLLDTLTQKFNYPKQKISITTCNLIEKHSDYVIKIVPQIKYLDSAVKHRNIVKDPEKIFDKDFKIFGNFIGHGNLPRLKLASYLYSIREQCLQTYHTTVTAEYHKPFLAIEEMMFTGESWKNIQRAIELIKNSPIILDEIQTYPILNPATFNITNVYPNFFVEIVNMTYFTGNTFYVDEKIWRPILMKTPFIVQGPHWFIQNLKMLGFKTFDNFWDEGYSEDPANIQADAIIKNIDLLKAKSNKELQQMYNDMLPILEHNYQVMINLNKNKIMNLFSETKKDLFHHEK